MSSHKQVHVNNNDKAQSTISSEKPSPAKKSMTAGEMFQSQTVKEEATENSAASALTTPAKNRSDEQEYLSPPHSTITADSRTLSKKRTAEKELSSSPNKKASMDPEFAGNIRDDVREYLLRLQMEAIRKLDEAKQSGTFAGDLDNLPDIDPFRPLDCNLDARRIWREDKLKLGQYPRLVTTRPRYNYTQARNRYTGILEWDCSPIAPADDIEKSLDLGPGTKGLKWTGPWAERKLQKEIAKYERIKEFWIFDYSHGTFFPYIPGLDKKDKFCASEYSKELQSPWVRGWLREFLGDKIMDCIEAELEILDGGWWKEASKNMLDLQRNWNEPSLRFESGASHM